MSTRMSAEMIEAPMPTCSARNSGDARSSSVILQHGFISRNEFINWF